jgi:hypothetical protein
MKHAIIGITLLLIVAGSAVGQPSSPRTERGQTVVEKLMPDGGTRRLRLPKPEERAQVIRQLRRMQTDIHKPDAQQVAFLLAVLGLIMNGTVTICFGSLKVAASQRSNTAATT